MKKENEVLETENEVLPLPAEVEEKTEVKAKKETSNISEALKPQIEKIDKLLSQFDAIEKQREIDALKAAEPQKKRTNMPLFIVTLTALGFGVVYISKKKGKDTEISPFADKEKVNGRG